MSAADIVSNALLLFGILIAPLVMFGWLSYYLGKSLSSTIRRRQQQRFLASLPCSRCYYSSGYETLQCAVNPTCVFTAEAYTCRDFSEIEKSSFNGNRRWLPIKIKGNYSG